MQKNGRLNCDAATASQVTPANVQAYITNVSAPVRSVTMHGYVQGLRRAAQLLAPSVDFAWLAEIEKDLKLVMEPRSKLDRLVSTMRLVEAGKRIMAEAHQVAKTDFVRARGVRNGLIIALCAFCPIRLKNFASLEIGYTFKEVRRALVDLPASGHYENWPARRASRPRIPQRRHQFLSPESPTRPPSGIHDKRALDFRKEIGPSAPASSFSRLISQLTHQTLGVAVTPPVPHGCGLYCGSMLRKHAAPRKRLARPHRPPRDGGTL